MGADGLRPRGGGDGAALARRAASAPASCTCVCVAAGWAYNLGLKRTWWSWLPYAVAFGALPAFVSLAGPDGEAPPWWWPVAGALLGVGAHLLNVLPDLADDEATDVRGFPHRLGPRRIPGVAAAVLLGASAASWWAPASRSWPAW